MSLWLGVFGTCSTISGEHGFAAVLLLGVGRPFRWRFAQLVGRPAHQHGVEVARRLIGNVQDDGVFQQARILHACGVHGHWRQGAAACCAFHRLVEPLDRGGNAPHHRDARHAVFAIDEPFDDGGLLAVLPLPMPRCASSSTR